MMPNSLLSLPILRFVTRRGLLTGAGALAATAGIAPAAEAQAAPSHLRFLNPAGIGKPNGYSHVVEMTGPGRTIYIAGQLGYDATGKRAGEVGDFQAQAVQVFENLKIALAAVGAGFEHVVKLNNYLTNISHLPIFRTVRDKYITSAPPASTTIEISKLARSDALLECEVIAVVAATAKVMPAR